MKIKPQITWLPLMMYAYTAIQTLVIYTLIIKKIDNSDDLLIYGTLVAVLWIERDSVIAILKGGVNTKSISLYGVVLFLLSIVIVFIGREITSLIIELWGLFLMASALVMLLSPPNYKSSATFIALSGSIIVLLGHFAPAFMSSEIAVAIAGISAKILNIFNPPVISSGVSVYFGQYAVEVVRACSGMNSMFSLLALSVIYIRQDGLRKILHIIILVGLVIPVAMLTNLIRVIILILITMHGGEQMSQGIFHDITGVLSFVIAVIILGVIDRGLSLIVAEKEKIKVIN
jgi:exosortase/archaeosortase family protein